MVRSAPLSASADVRSTTTPPHSQLYNNNVLVIRKHSPVSARMVDFVCQTPYSRNTAKFCKLVGTPCYPKWYWNHNLLQMAARQHLGMVFLPWSFTDPGCVKIN